MSHFGTSQCTLQRERVWTRTPKRSAAFGRTADELPRPVREAVLYECKVRPEQQVLDCGFNAIVPAGCRRVPLRLSLREYLGSKMTVPSDLIWSFATGSIFAASSSDGLKSAGNAFINKYFVYLACYVCFVLSPSRLYLLWEHTGWATVFYYDATVSGIWPCLYLVAVALLCVAGYLVGRHLILSGRSLAAYGLAACSFSCTVAVYSFWYERVLYAGDIGDWYSEMKYSKLDFFSSQVFLALLALGLLTVPPIVYATVAWPNDENLMIKARKRTLIRHSIKCYCAATAVKALLALVLVAATSSPARSPWSYGGLVAFLAGQAFWGAVLIMVLSCIRTRRKNKRAP